MKRSFINELKRRLCKSISTTALIYLYFIAINRLQKLHSSTEVIYRCFCYSPCKRWQSSFRVRRRAKGCFYLFISLKLKQFIFYETDKSRLSSVHCLGFISIQTLLLSYEDFIKLPLI